MKNVSTIASFLNPPPPPNIIWLYYNVSLSLSLSLSLQNGPDRRGRNRMAAPVQSVHITTKAVSSNPTHWEAYSRQHYVIKCVSNLR